MKRASLIRVVSLAALAVLGLTTAAQAQKGPRKAPGGAPPCTDPIPSERQTQLLERFGEQGIDADSNGTLTCAELKAFFGAHAVRPNGGPGGPVQQCTDPLPSRRQAQFLERFNDQGIDADSNGTLTCAEVQAFFETHPDLRPGRPGDAMQPCTDPMPSRRQTQLLERFAAQGIDADSNGALTCAEVKAFFEANPTLRPGHPGEPPPCTDPIPTEEQTELLERFGDQTIDADSNGTLTCDEVNAFFEANRPPDAPGCQGPVHPGGPDREGHHPRPGRNRPSASEAKAGGSSAAKHR